MFRNLESFTDNNLDKFSQKAGDNKVLYLTFNYVYMNVAKNLMQ